MQEPDANGFVHVSWPSKNISHGGIFHTRIVEPSENQQQLLKVLLQESKLAMVQRQKAPWKLRENDEQQVLHHRAPMPLVRPKTSRRRSLSEIRQSGVYEVDGYRPLKRGEDREKMKERLAHTMAYGDDKPQVPIQVVPASLVKPKPKLPTNKDKWNDLVTQIRERSEWLAEMEYLGHAGPHRELIKDQIAERMRALDALGIDSEVSTPRSTMSAFSTTRSREPTPAGLNASLSAKTVKSGKSSVSGASEKGKPTRRSRTRVQKEENVAALAQFSPLQYSPRRRV